MEESGGSPLLKLPPVDYADYLLRYLVELGFYETSMNGLEPLSWTEIKAWRDVTGSKVTMWDVQQLRHLSIEFVQQAKRSTEIHCPPPFSPQEFDRTQASRKMGSLLRSLVSRNSERRGRARTR